MSQLFTTQAARRIVLFPWGGVVEDFLGPIGISRRAFAEEMSGGWLFGYVEALRRQGVETIILGFSSAIDQPERLTNHVTDTVTVYLPTTRLYRMLRRWPGDLDDTSRPKLWGAAVLQALVRYFSTPLGLVAAALQAEGVSAILVQEYEHPRFDVLTGVGCWLGMPVFATFQGAPAPASCFERWVRRRTIRRAAGFVIASAPEAERVQATYRLTRARIAAIPNPLDLDLWRPEPRAASRVALGLPETARIVICHGRIDISRKGIDLLFEAWRRIIAARPGRDLRLHLIGSGQDDRQLTELLATDPVPGLRWVARYITDRWEMRRELSAADFYTLPSRHEGFPVAPLEAMACGLPVVAAAAPGVEDILPGGEASGGIVTPVGDSHALEAALGRMLDDDLLRARLAERARSRAAEFASLDAVGSRLAAFLSARTAKVHRQ